MIVPIVIVDEQSVADRPLNGSLLSNLLQHAAALDGQPWDDVSGEPSFAFGSPVIIADDKHVGSYGAARSGFAWRGQRTIVANACRNKLSALVAAALSVPSSDQLLFLPTNLAVDAGMFMSALQKGAALARRGRFVKFELSALRGVMADESSQALENLVLNEGSALLLVDAIVFLNSVLDFDKATLDAAEVAVGNATRYGRTLLLPSVCFSTDGPSLKEVMTATLHLVETIYIGGQ